VVGGPVDHSKEEPEFKPYIFQNNKLFESAGISIKGQYRQDGYEAGNYKYRKNGF
jgi:hypothetical protein